MRDGWMGQARITGYVLALQQTVASSNDSYVIWRFQVDSELGESMSKLQARQLVVLRHQLDHAFLVNSNQKAQLEKEVREEGNTFFISEIHACKNAHARPTHTHTHLHTSTGCPALMHTQEARAEKAEAEAVRANSMAYKLTRDIEKMRGFTGPDIRQGDDSDSAYGMAGEKGGSALEPVVMH